MGTEGRLARVIALATLQRSRSQLSGRIPRLLAVCVTVVYGFLALQVGLMLTFGPTGQSSTSYELLWGNGASAWWNYPALLVIFPGGVLALPFFGTVVMVLVSIGVGIGMSVGILLTARLLARRRRELGGPASAGALAGLTPAMIGLVTLGACCSTTAAATAGIGALAQASGSSLDAVLLNGWYIGVFQLAVLWVALIAQEQLLVVYGVLLGGTDAPAPAAPIPTGRAVGALVLRLALIAAGVTWALGGLAQWGFGGAVGATASNVVGWLLVHALLGVLAVLLGLFPVPLSRWMDRPLRGIRSALAVALTVASLSLLAWLPRGVASTGWHGLFNEVFATLSAPASWAPFPPGSIGPLALALRWGFQFVLLGAAGMTFAWRPVSLGNALTGAPIHRSSERPAGPVARADPGGAPAEPVPSAAVVR